MVDEGERVAALRPLRCSRPARGGAAALRSFAIARHSSEEAQLASLRRAFRIRSDGGGEEQRLFLDTFDERLHRRGHQLFLASEGARPVLEWNAPGQRSLREAVETAPAFAADLPSGSALRGVLEPVAELRRLHPMIHVEETWRSYRLEDEEGKTVVRLRFQQAVARGAEPAAARTWLPDAVEVCEVRGYSGAFRQVCRFLDERRGLAPASASLLERAYAALRRQPVASAKFQPELDPGAPAPRAALRILGELRQVMVANEDGIRRDLDIEYLHDFRVAVRRSRTLLRAFGELLAGPELDAVTQGLRWLGQATGPTRDADVHRIALRAEIAAARGEDRAALEHLGARLATRRQLEWKRLVTALDGPHYGRVLACIEAFADPDRSSPVEAAAVPRLDLFAAHCLETAFRRFLKRGRRLARGAPDPAVHRVRIEAKRLRYLLEFFGSLHPGDEIARDIKALRRVQDELGSFNDAAVQQGVLRALALEAAGDRETGPEELIAAGRLIERLEGEKERHRRRVVKRFERFDSRAIRDGFERLWRPVVGSTIAAPR